MKHREISLLATVLALILGCNSQDGHNGTVVASAPTTAPTTQPIAMEPRQKRDVEQMRKALTYLASDELEGRGLQTDGLDKAADFIASSFKSSGLKPLPGNTSYFQPFSANLGTKVGPATNLQLGDSTLKLNDEYTPLGISSEGSFSGPLAFVGYSISSDDLQYDDFAGIDVKGKVALAIRYEPQDKDGNSLLPKSDGSQAALTAKAKAAADHGAVALLIVNPPSTTEPDRLSGLGRTRGAKAAIPVLQITRAAAQRILGSTGSDLDKPQNQIDSTLKPASFVVSGATASGDVQLEQQTRQTRNVMAYLPGKGPLRDEFVVVGAHYDHLGKGEVGAFPGAGQNQIYNGADDNASGTAALLQLAKRMSRDSHPRSIIFVTFSGEERGLLGSAYFVNNPPVPLEKIVAMFNMDMVGRLNGDAVQIGGTGTSAQFDGFVAAADEESPLKLKPAGSDVGGKGGMGPSDHAAFAGKKIPVLFLWTGQHEDYHRPTDDVDKINFAGMAHIVDAAEDLVNRLAEMPRGEYVDKFDRSMSASGMRVRLGIMPDYAEEVEGVKVSSVTKDGAAGQAGIVAGDVIVQIGMVKVVGMDDYMKALGDYKPGDTVTIAVLRDGERKDVQATFPRRRGRSS